MWEIFLFKALDSLGITGFRKHTHTHTHVDPGRVDDAGTL